MFLNNKMTWLTLLSVLLFSATALLVFNRAAMKKEHARLASSLQDALSLQQRISEAALALFQDEPERSLAFFALADAEQQDGSPNWATLAQEYLNARSLTHDSLAQSLENSRRQFQRLSQCQFQYRRLDQEAKMTGEKWADLLEMHNQLSLQYEAGESQKQVLLHEKSTLIEENRQWQDSLQRLSESIGQIEFVNRKGLKINYFGYLKDGEASGYGVGFYESGGIYRGQWARNARNGYGVYVWKNGDYYEGDFVEGQKHGHGTYYFKSGEKFVGAWRDDQRNGYGEFFSPEGKLLLKGQWKNDKLDKNAEKEKESKVAE